MRICFVGHQDTKEGAGRYLLDQVDYLIHKSIDVCAILPGDGPLYHALAKRRVDVRIVANPWWTRTTTPASGPDYGATLTAARRMAALFRHWAVDVAYTQTVVAPAGAMAAALADLPHIWHIHEFSYNPNGIEMSIDQPSLARLMELTSNIVLFNSKSVAAEWTEWIETDKTAVVYNWTKSAADHPAKNVDAVSLEGLQADDVFLIAIVGSLVRWKRQGDAIDAVGALMNEGLDIGLVIVGPPVDPTFAAELLESGRRQRRPDRIRFLGYCEDPESIMRAAHVTVVCSDREPFGRVTVESMAQGTPVVGSNSGGTAEIIEDGTDGLLYPTGDVAALTRALRTIIQDTTLRSRLADGAKKKAKRFQDADAAMAPVMSHLESLVGKSNPSSPLGAMIGSGLAADGEVDSVNARARRYVARTVRAFFDKRRG